MRPIDADALKTKIINTTFFSEIGQFLKIICKIIDDAPTVELIAKPVDNSSLKEQLEALSPHEIKSMTISDLIILANKLNMTIDIHLTPLSEEDE